jgi:hypothetical protein
MSNPWIRLYRDSLHNPKIVSLSDRQHRVWHNLLLIADDEGQLPISRDIACHLRVSIAEVEQLLGELLEAGLVDRNLNGPGIHRFQLHDWNTHQYVSDTSTERVRKFRNKNKRREDETFHETERDVSVTPPEPEPEPEPDTDFVSSSENMPREGKEQSFKSGFGNGLGRGGLDSLKSRAEGFGLPVDELIDITNRNKPRNRAAYFTSVCVKRLKDKLPAFHEGVIRDALWGKGNAAGLVFEALMQAEAA